MSKANLKETLSQPLLTIDHNASMAEASRTMLRRKIRHLPVTRDGQIVGVLSQRDVQRAANVEVYHWNESVIQEEHFDPLDRVGEFMSWPIKSVDISAPIDGVVRKILAEKISSLLVTQDAVPIGIVTTDDLLRLIIDGSQGHAFVSGLKANIGSFLDGLSSSGI